jgi:hypothetical protein
VEVRVLYFEGCPNAAEAERRVRQAVADRADIEVVLERVDDPADAARLGMHGSPTILVDGTDPFATPDTPTSWSCRVYPPTLGSHGVPTVERLTAAFS